jgi:hypothetical protein
MTEKSHRTWSTGSLYDENKNETDGIPHSFVDLDFEANKRMRQAHRWRQFCREARTNLSHLAIERSVELRTVEKNAVAPAIKTAPRTTRDRTQRSTKLRLQS